MKRLRYILLAALLPLLVIFGLTFIQRSNLPYNSEGRYFDEENFITYHEQAVMVYGFLTFICLAMTTAVIVWIIKTRY